MNDIGLFELIEAVKLELLRTPENDVRLFAVGAVELEVSFTATRAANGKIDLKVVSAGGDMSSERVQRVTITLEPLVTVEELRDHYRKLHPEKLPVTAEKLVRGIQEND